jgi:hypothetical protein
MAQVLLITPEYLRKYTAFNDAIEDNLIYPATKLAQDKWLESYLGTDLINKLYTDVAGSGTSGNYTTLLENYVQPMLMWYTVVEIMPNIYTKFVNGSLVIRTSDDTQVVDIQLFNKMVSDARNNAQHYTQRLINYLCANSSLFPEYNSNQFPDMSPKKDNYNENSMVFSSGNTAMSNPQLRGEWCPTWCNRLIN